MTVIEMLRLRQFEAVLEGREPSQMLHLPSHLAEELLKELGEAGIPRGEEPAPGLGWVATVMGVHVFCAENADG